MPRKGQWTCIYSLDYLYGGLEVTDVHTSTGLNAVIKPILDSHRSWCISSDRAVISGSSLAIFAGWTLFKEASSKQSWYFVIAQYKCASLLV